ncbi:MAG: hypothetical protein NTX36_15305 [Proteobacteria bacterium]|nr:hypothetical protein [Pseudomonadota bacterium]
MDQAKGILSFIQLRHPDKGYELDGVMSALVSCTRRPEDLPGEVAKTVLAIAEIVGKSIMTLFNGLSLLKLSPEIQAAIQAGNLPVSQGYLFASNLDCPDLRGSEQ